MNSLSDQLPGCDDQSCLYNIAMCCVEMQHAFGMFFMYTGSWRCLLPVKAKVAQLRSLIIIYPSKHSICNVSDLSSVDLR